MIFIHYIYQAFIRLQIALGGHGGKYTQWKARLLLIALGCWWIIILAAWIKVFFRYDFIFTGPVFIKFMLAGLLVWATQLCFSSEESFKGYESMFRAWPKRKRVIWDLYAIAFLILTIAFMLLSLMLIRK